MAFVSLRNQPVPLAENLALDFVYLSNVLGHRAESLAAENLAYENTYCPACGELLIWRRGLSVAQYGLEDERCSRCGRAIPAVV